MENDLKTEVLEVQNSRISKLKLFFHNLSSKTKLIAGFLVMLVMLSFLGIRVYLDRTTQIVGVRASGVSLKLSSSHRNPRVGSTFVVAVSVDTQGQEMVGADIKIRYNPRVFEARSIQAGNSLPTVIVPGSINNGVATITVGSLIDSNGAHPSLGAGVLAQVAFRAISSGTSDIVFAPGNSIAVIGKTTNALDSVTSVRITVEEGSNSTPVRTPTPTPILTPITTSIVITNGGVNVNYSPWAIALVGTGLTSGLKARLIDTDGRQWGSDIRAAYSRERNFAAFQLPSNSPPSNCNKGKTCIIGVYMVTTSGVLSNKYDITLPAN